MRPELFKYISGILTNIDQFSLAVNGYKDHVHLFFEMSPAKSLSEIVRIVKANSSKCPPDRTGRDIYNRQIFMAGSLSAVRQGYGGFSYSRSQRDEVIKYTETWQVPPKAGAD